MNQFPERIQLPNQVTQQRKERLDSLIKSCKRGLSIRTAIILAELIGVLFFGSSSLLMDALASLIDVASTLLLIFSLKFAEKPPDENHPFGHGRIEPLIGLQLSVMLALIGGGMLFQQFFALSSEKVGVYIDPRTWIIPFCAVILLEISYQIAMRAAKRQHSPALAADAVHYRMDGITSLFAALALIVAAYYPEWSVFIDHCGAITIAILMIGFGIYASIQNVNQLLDKTPNKEFFEKVVNAAKRVDGVLGTEKIRIQLSGPDAHVDIDIEVSPSLTVEVAHEISQKVRVEIQKEWPLVRDVTVHIEPYYPGDH